MTIFDDLKRKIREENKNPSTLGSFARFLSSGNGIRKNPRGTRKNWKAEQYFKQLDLLLQEMRSKGYITNYNAIHNLNTHEKAGQVEISDQAILTLRHDSSVTYSDEEIIKKWGLDQKIPETFNLDSWRRIQRSFDKLKELFGPDQGQNPEYELPRGKVKPIYGDGVAQIDFFHEGKEQNAEG
jgi:hypothetical protein